MQLSYKHKNNFKHAGSTGLLEIECAEYIEIDDAQEAREKPLLAHSVGVIHTGKPFITILANLFVQPVKLWEESGAVYHAFELELKLYGSPDDAVQIRKTLKSMKVML